LLKGVSGFSADSGICKSLIVSAVVNIVT